ncbi:MAG TPA: non-canonical purine NTP pyrophosphatase [Kofleriaceae bacterium]|nr:non-canonical purine NTP pyrophosphatase [Kofleriaceae bacterium]
MKVHFLDGNEPRMGELRRLVPGLELVLTGLPSGFSTSAPDPAERARGMVLAADVFPCVAEAVDLTTMEGNSLRLELDSENDNRFCRWWRETAVRFHLCVALRTTAGADVALFRGEINGRIADKPSGARPLGWDRLFMPEGFDETLADLVDTDADQLRARLYSEMARQLV